MRAARSTVRLCASALAAVTVGTLAEEPRAQTPITTDQAATTAPIGCVLTGTGRLGPDVVIYDAPTDGEPIARFTGGDSPLRINAFPASPGRARVSTATGNGGFRITGFVDSSRVPVYTQRKTPVVIGYLWIGAQREVRVRLGTTTRLQVEKSLTHPLRQTFRGWEACDAFSLTAGSPPGWDVPGNARGWKLNKDSVDLYDDWRKGRSRVATLTNGKGMLLWEIEQSGAFVKLEYHGEIEIKAWAKIGDVTPLPRGEREDVLAPPIRRHNPPRLRLAEVPKEVTTTKAIRLRLEPREKGKVIGVIEPNTETYVLDVVVGWASVLPKSLHVAPHGDAQFWAPASELGLKD